MLLVNYIHLFVYMHMVRCRPFQLIDYFKGDYSVGALIMCIFELQLSCNVIFLLYAESSSFAAEKSN